jgi:ABC-type uncharacterized transport system substrate-binding protein
VHRWWRRLLTLAFALLPLGSAAGHPHIFIKHGMTLIFGAHDLVGIRMRWTFDEMYSAMIQSDYTKAQDGTVTADDVKTIEKENFANLENYNFFVDLKVNDAPVRVSKVRDFDARFRDHRAVFEFTVPLDPPEKTGETRDPDVVEIGVFDPEYYVEFTLLDRDPVTIEHGEAFAAQCDVVRDQPRNTFLGTKYTDLAVCTYRVTS